MVEVGRVQAGRVSTSGGATYWKVIIDLEPL